MNKILEPLGCELVSLRQAQPPPGTLYRPIGNIRLFLEDIQARGLPCRGVIDVGANKGDWTRMALSVFPESNYLMIEPQQEMADTLNSLCRKHRNLTCVIAGAGKQEGELLQTIYKDPRGSTFLPSTDEARLRGGVQRKTKILTLDAIISRHQFEPSLVKLDVQGFELEVLGGAQSCFGTTEVFILETSLYQLYEAMPTTREVIAFMAEKDYELYDITEFLRRPYDGALGQIDLAFAKKSGFLRNSNRWA